MRLRLDRDPRKACTYWKGKLQEAWKVARMANDRLLEGAVTASHYEQLAKSDKSIQGKTWLRPKVAVDVAFGRRSLLKHIANYQWQSRQPNSAVAALSSDRAHRFML